jgi:HPt (histidine-containing phosphotransfer) domain-containing protein
MQSHNDEMVMAIMQDIKKALIVLEGMTGDARDKELFRTTVHGMKSSLAGMGEPELSAAAFKLERAADNDDFDTITSETPRFIADLKTLTEKYKKPEAEYAEQDCEDNMIYLKEKLGEIKAACEAYNKRTAKAFLAELKQRKWTRTVNDTLDEISLCLLHGEFKKIISIAKGFCD